jgi:hypothetical protein
MSNIKAIKATVAWRSHLRTISVYRWSDDISVLVAIGGHLHGAAILSRTASNPASWNVASWPRPEASSTLIFSRAPSGSDRKNPAESFL